jgi:hypothetical protein
MKTTDRICQALVATGVTQPSVFKGWHHSTLKTGWHYIEFGRSEAIFLGTSLGEALEGIALRAEFRAEG